MVKIGVDRESFDLIVYLIIISEEMNMNLLLLSHRSLKLFISVFSLLFRLGKFYGYILKFTESVLCHFHSTIESI